MTGTGVPPTVDDERAPAGGVCRGLAFLLCAVGSGLLLLAVAISGAVLLRVRQPHDDFASLRGPANVLIVVFALVIAVLIGLLVAAWAGGAPPSLRVAVLLTAAAGVLVLLSVQRFGGIESEAGQAGFSGQHATWLALRLAIGGCVAVFVGVIMLPDRETSRLRWAVAPVAVIVVAAGVLTLGLPLLPSGGTTLRVADPLPPVPPIPAAVSGPGRSLPAGITDAMAFGPGYLVSSRHGGLLTMHDATGAQRWRFDLAPGVNSAVSLLPAESLVVVARVSDRADTTYAIDAASGRLRWTAAGLWAVPDRHFDGTLATGHTLIQPTADRSAVSAVSPATGTRIWEHRVPADCAMDWFSGSRDVLEAHTYCTGTEMFVRVIDPATGALRRTTPYPPAYDKTVPVGRDFTLTRTYRPGITTIRRTGTGRPVRVIRSADVSCPSDTDCVSVADGRVVLFSLTGAHPDLVVRGVTSARDPVLLKDQLIFQAGSEGDGERPVVLVNRTTGDVQKVPASRALALQAMPGGVLATGADGRGFVLEGAHR
ncbi:outer membrane protein assembly factor BamB family protein [Gordonia sp. FQ]|uniref:outer membrane protein assembly factor BamB family protein n=1 Tax=Gordonia sp. FQ TaxID=3446634 RepID=UPI003F87CE89